MTRSFLAPILVVMSMSFFAVISLDRFCQLHQEYMRFSAKLEQDRRLISICRNTTNKDILSIYTNACLEAESNARIGAFMLALNSVTGATHFEGAATEVMLSLRALGWPFMALVVAAFMICPSLVFRTLRSKEPYGEWRRKNDKHES